MVLIALNVLGFLVGFYIWRRRQRKKRLEALVKELVLSYLNGDTARMDQVTAELKDLGVTDIKIEEIPYDE